MASSSEELSIYGSVRFSILSRERGKLGPQFSQDVAPFVPDAEIANVKFEAAPFSRTICAAFERKARDASFSQCSPKEMSVVAVFIWPSGSGGVQNADGIAVPNFPSLRYKAWDPVSTLLPFVDSDIKRDPKTAEQDNEGPGLVASFLLNSMVAPFVSKTAKAGASGFGIKCAMCG
jgi:hypothetical protein